MLDEEQAALMRRCVVAAAPKTLSADQLAGLELVCSGRDGLIILRTGGGKTLLWQLPALQGGGLNVVVVPSVALALDLKASTDKILAGTAFFCVHDVRSEGKRGEAVAPPARVPSVAAPALAAVGMEFAARLWRCETECASCTGQKAMRLRCIFKCGTCKNCRTKRGGCRERRRGGQSSIWLKLQTYVR
jgi:hypothetical protein